MPRRRRAMKRLRQVGIALLVLAAAAFVGEWLCRGFQDKLLDPRTNPLLAFDPMLGHTFKPYLSVDLENASGERVVVDINSIGLRDREIAPRGPGEVRIVGVGDGFTAAIPVPLADTYLKQVERLIQADLRPGLTCRVIDAGVDGYDLRQESDFLRKRGERLAPDVVLVALYVGDDVKDYGRKTGLPLPGKEFLRRTSYLYHMLRLGYHRIRSVGRPRSSGADPDSLAAWRAVFSRYGEPPGDEEILRYVRDASREAPLYCENGTPTSAWSATGLMLERIRDRARLLGARTVLVLLPTSRQVLPREWEKTASLLDLARETCDLDRPEAELTRIAARLDIPSVDLLPAFRSYPSPDSLYGPGRRSWSRKGHLLAAECIRGTLASTVK